MAEKNIKMADLLRFFYFSPIIWPWEGDNLNISSCILPKFVMHVTNDYITDKLGQIQ